jgi:hypothetical protein
LTTGGKTWALQTAGAGWGNGSGGLRVVEKALFISLHSNLPARFLHLNFPACSTFQDLELNDLYSEAALFQVSVIPGHSSSLEVIPNGAAFQAESRISGSESMAFEASREIPLPDEPRRHSG